MSTNTFNLKKTFYIIILFATVLFSCTKEINELTFDLQNNKSIIMGIGDIAYFPYSVSGSNIDSVCFYVNGTLESSSIKRMDTLFFEASETGDFETMFRVFHHGGLYKDIESPNVYVNSFSSYKFDLELSSIDGSPGYYIGDSIRINLILETIQYGIDQIAEVSLNLEMDETEYYQKKTTAPFEFITPEINANSFKVQMNVLTKDFQWILIEQTIELQQDESPEIKILNGNTIPHEHFSADSLYFYFTAWDNNKLDEVRFFVNDELYLSFQVEDKRISESFYVSNLPLGKNSFYFEVTDNNGNMIESEHHYNFVYKSIFSEERLRDHVRIGSTSNHAFLSTHNLFFINEESQSITQIIELPSTYCKAIDYHNTTNKLYIATNDGRIIYFDILSNSFGQLFDYSLGIIMGLEVDELNDRLLVKQHNTFSFVGISENKALTLDIDFDKIRDYVYFPEKQTILITSSYGFYDDFFYKIRIDGENYLILDYFENFKSSWISKHPNKNTFFWEEYEYDVDNLTIVGDYLGKNLGDYTFYSENGQYMYYLEELGTEIAVYNTQTYQEVYRKKFLWDYMFSQRIYQTANPFEFIMTFDITGSDQSMVVFGQLGHF